MVLLLISACSNTTKPAKSATGGNHSQAVSTTNQNAGAANKSSNAGNAAAATKTYMDSKGEVSIPLNPERIIDLAGSAIGNLLCHPISLEAQLKFIVESFLGTRK